MTQDSTANPWRETDIMLGPVSSATAAQLAAVPDDDIAAMRSAIEANAELIRQTGVDIAALRARLDALPPTPPTPNWATFLRSLLSRKLMLTVLGALIAIAAAVQGELPPEWAGGIAAGLSALYVVIEGMADAGERKAAASPAPVVVEKM